MIQESLFNFFFHSWTFHSYIRFRSSLVLICLPHISPPAPSLLSGSLTSPFSTFFFPLVIINVQVVLIPFYVSRHWLSHIIPHWAISFIKVVTINGRLFSVIYLQLLKIQLILVYPCWSNSVAFWRLPVPSNVFCTMYATNYGYLYPSGMMSPVFLCSVCCSLSCTL